MEFLDGELQFFLLQCSLVPRRRVATADQHGHSTEMCPIDLSVYLDIYLPSGKLINMIDSGKTLCSIGKINSFYGHVQYLF